MNEELTFEKVKKAHDEAAHYLEVNKVLLFHTARPAHATWLDESLLARLFYDSSKEWLKGFQDNATRYAGITNRSDERLEMVNMSADLLDRLEAFKEKILSKFSQDESVMEALTAR